MIKTSIRSYLLERTGNLPGDFKIRLLDSLAEGSEVDFVGIFGDVEVCSGRCYIGTPSSFSVSFINEKEPVWKIFRVLCKLLDLHLAPGWVPHPYPLLPKVFDGNSIKKFFHGVIESLFKVPVQSRLLLVDKNFRFQPDDASAKISAPRYRVEVSFLGELLLAIDLARGLRATFIQNQKNSDTNFVPVDSRVLAQMKVRIKDDRRSSGKKVLTNDRLSSHDFFYYFEKAKELAESWNAQGACENS